MSLLKNIEAILRREAKKQGVPLLEFSKAIGMTEAGFYKMLSTGSMKVKTLEMIAERLQLPIQAFLIPVEDAAGQFAGTQYANTAHLQSQIAVLENTLADKDKIIALQRAHMENQQQLLALISVAAP